MSTRPPPSRLLALLLVPTAALAALAPGCGVLARSSSEHGRLLAAQAGAERVGAETCVGCHDAIGVLLAPTVHRDTLGCEVCHGPGGQHAEDPPAHIVGPGALEAMSVRGKAEMCLDCHGEMTLPWMRGNHAARLACYVCHSDVVHFAPANAVAPPASFRRQAGFCEQCHAADVIGFRQPFHHPVPEGAMRCTDCHDVHGRERRAFVLEQGGRCRTCHPREAGPHVFRHAALEDGCTACHYAHGSPIAALLVQQGNNLCLQCHFDAGFPVIQGVGHGVFLANGARCWDCHVEMHGSNTDPTLLGRVR